MTNGSEAIETLANRRVGHGQTSKAAWLENLEKYGMSYAVQWSEEALHVAELANLWAGVLQGQTNGHDIVEVLESEVKRVTRALMGDMVHERSTSLTSNAVAAARAKAYSRFVQEAEEVLAVA